MLEIYFVRHGESAGNKENRFRGRYDFPLNENGIRQAESLRDTLREIQFDAIYSSPLSRALKTAETLANDRITVTIDPGFINISLGEWENTPKDVVKQKFPELWQLWLTEPEKLSFPGMETLAQVQQRSYGRMMELVQQHKQGRIAVVTHRAVIKPLFAAMLHIPQPYFWKLHMDTAAYSIATYSPERKFTFLQINQNKHLESFVREDLG